MKKFNTELAKLKKKAATIVDDAKNNAELEAQKIIENAKKEAKSEALKMRELLRLEVSKLALKGAEQILQKQIDEKTHLDILKKLEAEL